MKIKIENFLIETTANTDFNLTEQKKGFIKGKPTMVTDTVAYNISLPRAIEIIVHSKLHENPNVLSLSQFRIEYMNEHKRMEKLLSLEKLKQ